MTNVAPALKIVEILINFLKYTRDYILNIAHLFVSKNAPLPIAIIGIAFLYAIIKGGLMENWKIIVASIIVAIILSTIYS